MKKYTLALAVVGALGGACLFAPAQAAPASPAAIVSTSDVVQVQSMRGERRMMRHNMMRRHMMRHRMKRHHMMRHRMMHRRMRSM